MEALSFVWSLLLSIACCLFNLLPTEISKFELCTVHFMYISSNVEQILADERGNINIGSLYGKMSWKGVFSPDFQFELCSLPVSLIGMK